VHEYVPCQVVSFVVFDIGEKCCQYLKDSITRDGLTSEGAGARYQAFQAGKIKHGFSGPNALVCIAVFEVRNTAKHVATAESSYLGYRSTGLNAYAIVMPGATRSAFLKPKALPKTICLPILKYVPLTQVTMKRSLLYWILAVILTLSSAVYQRMTGPTHPVRGSAVFAGGAVQWKLDRSHGGAGDQPVRVFVPDSGTEGSLFFKRYKTDDEWTRMRMMRHGDTLSAMLPHQPPAGKLEYAVELHAGDSFLRIPEVESIVTRFKGHVPDEYLFPHVILMFLAMLFSMRVGLEAFRRDARLRTLVIWTTILLTAGGMILGPIVQKFAFGAFWTGFPFGTDLTDNKTLVAFIAWIAALIVVLRSKESPVRRWMVLVASIITLAVYLIPHSMMGSELNYRELDKLQMQETLREEASSPETP
jgi:hypothetical protein